MGHRERNRSQLLARGPLFFMDRLRADIGEVVRRAARAFQRPLRISEPCYGMGGVRELFGMGCMQYEAVNVYDIEGKLKDYHNFAARGLGRWLHGPRANRLG